MRRRNLTAYGFLAPYLLIFAAFWVWPIVYSFWLSFLFTRRQPWTFNPNTTWGRLAEDPAFWNALQNTLLILVVQVPIMIALATVLAVLLNSWRWAGYNAIIILSGLQSIPDDVYEAATLDRVSPLRQFFFITLPLLRPVILFSIVLSVIGTMQLFAEPFLITNEGGPGGATETLGLFLYRQGFQVLNFGYASAVAYTIAALAVMISLLNLWLGREKA
jgi:ABC-type sugar transport system permease subunit